MKKIAVLLTMLGISLGANAQLLWKISGKDLSEPSYIMGTHHLGPLSILDSIAGFRPALDSVKQVYGELTMDEMMSPESMQTMQKAVILPGDTTLHTLLGKEKFDSAAVAVKDLMGMDLQMMDKIKPIVLTTQITTLSYKDFKIDQQLDTWIQTEAKSQGKKIGGLETMEYQMEIFMGYQSLQRQAEDFYDAVMNFDESEQSNRDLTEAYMKQDLEELEKIFNKEYDPEDSLAQEEMNALVYNRNANWAEQMPTIMKEASTMFVVGSGHLPGERGVLNLLRKQGYSIEPVK